MYEDQQEFLRLLRKLLSTDNTIRGNAETTLDGISVETRATYLLSSIRNTTAGEDVRQMAAGLLRQLISDEFEDFYNQLIPEHQTHFKNVLLATIQTETQAGMRWKIFEVVSELARQLLDEEGNNLWPDFLRFLFESASNGTPEMKVDVLETFGNMPGIFGNLQSQNLNGIQRVLQQCLADITNYPVRFQAVKSLSSFIIFNKDDENVTCHFLGLTERMIPILAESILKQDDDTLLKCVVDLAENIPSFFRRQIQPLMQICKQAVINNEYEESWRHLAIQVIITLSNTEPEATAALMEVLEQRRELRNDSPRVEFVRNYSYKFQQQNLYGFMTSFVGTSFTLTCRKEQDFYHAVLTVYGEESPFDSREELKATAEHVVLLRYVNDLYTHHYITRRYEPGSRFEEFKNRIRIGLAAIGNYHPHVAVVQLEKRFPHPQLRSEVTPNEGFPLGSIPLYKCTLRITPRNTAVRYVEIASAPQKKEAKVAAYTNMAIKLFLAGVIEAYSPLSPEEKECVVLIRMIRTTEDSPTIKTSLQGLQELINVAGNRFRASMLQHILTAVKPLLGRPQRSTRLEAGRCMDSLVRHLPAEELEALLRQASEENIRDHPELIWTINEVLSIRLHAGHQPMPQRPDGAQAMPERPAGLPAILQRPAGLLNVQQQSRRNVVTEQFQQGH